MEKEQTINYVDKSVYEGEWKDEMRHGRGIFTWASSACYEGEF
jgi:hypothetical protein